MIAILAESEKERIKCQVDGETYMDGDSFSPKGNPELSCQCMEGYQGMSEIINKLGKKSVVFIKLSNLRNKTR